MYWKTNVLQNEIFTIVVYIYTSFRKPIFVRINLSIPCLYVFIFFIIVCSNRLLFIFFFVNVFPKNIFDIYVF